MSGLEERCIRFKAIWHNGRLLNCHWIKKLLTLCWPPQLAGVEDDEGGCRWRNSKIWWWVTIEVWEFGADHGRVDLSLWLWVWARESVPSPNLLWSLPGKWSVEQLKENKVPGDLGLVLKSRAKHHAISALLNKPFVFEDDALVVQWVLAFPLSLYNVIYWQVGLGNILLYMIEEKIISIKKMQQQKKLGKKTFLKVRKIFSTQNFERLKICFLRGWKKVLANRGDTHYIRLFFHLI